MIHLATNDYKRRAPIYSHAETQATRGELHFNELLILVRAVIITHRMNIYVPCLKLRNRRETAECGFTEKQLIYRTHTPFSLSETYITI